MLTKSFLKRLEIRVETIITIPSIWVLAYYGGLGFSAYIGSKTQKWNLIFMCMMVYMTVLTIGLRLAYE